MTIDSHNVINGILGGGLESVALQNLGDKVFRTVCNSSTPKWGESEVKNKATGGHMFHWNENWQPHIGRLELFVESFIQKGTKGVEWNTDQNTFAFWDFMAVLMQRVVCIDVFEDLFVGFKKLLSYWADNNVHVCSKNTIQGAVFFRCELMWNYH